MQDARTGRNASGGFHLRSIGLSAAVESSGIISAALLGFRDVLKRHVLRLAQLLPNAYIERCHCRSGFRFLRKSHVVFALALILALALALALAFALTLSR